MARALSLLLVAGLAFAAVLIGGGGSAAEVGRPAPAGTLVFTAGSNRLTAIDVASGRRTVMKVPSAAACGPQMHVTGGHVIFAAIEEDRTVVYSAPVALDAPPRRLGAAHAFVPSATEGRIWLAGVSCTRNAMVGVREVTVDGRVTQESRRAVPPSWLAAAAPGGLVLERSRELAVWDPGTGRSGRPLALQAVAAAGGSLLAGCLAGPSCSGLSVVDTAGGRRVDAQPPRGHDLELDARFSPDGALLAAPASAGRRWSVALVDTRTGRTSLVRGTRSRQYPMLSWAASSGWLFVGQGRRLLAYRPGQPRAVALPFRAPRRAIGFVAG